MKRAKHHFLRQQRRDCHPVFRPTSVRSVISNGSTDFLLAFWDLCCRIIFLIVSLRYLLAISLRYLNVCSKPELVQAAISRLFELQTVYGGIYIAALVHLLSESIGMVAFKDLQLNIVVSVWNDDVNIFKQAGRAGICFLLYWFGHLGDTFHHSRDLNKRKDKLQRYMKRGTFTILVRGLTRGSVSLSEYIVYIYPRSPRSHVNARHRHFHDSVGRHSETPSTTFDSHE